MNAVDVTLPESSVASERGQVAERGRSMLTPLVRWQVAVTIGLMSLMLAACVFILAPLAGVAVAGVALLLLCINYPPLILFLFFTVLGTMWTFDEWPMMPLRPAVVFLVLSTVLALAARKLWPRMHWIPALVAALGAWMFVTGALSGEVISTTSYAATVFGWAFAILALMQFGDGRQNLLLLAIAFVAGMCVGSLGVILHYVRGEVDVMRPINGDVNDYGVLLAAALMLGMGVFVASRVPLPVKLVTALLMLPILVATAGTLSRGTYLAVGLGLVSLLVVGRSGRRAFAWVVALGAVALGLAVTFMSDRFSQALEQKSNIAGENVDSRLEAWNLAMSLFAERPVTGFGVGTIGEHLRSVYQTPPGAFVVEFTHNTYVEVIYGTGLVGTALFGILLVFCVRSSLGLPDSAVPILPAVVAIFVSSFTVTEILYAPFWVLAAFACTADIIQRRSAFGGVKT